MKRRAWLPAWLPASDPGQGAGGKAAGQRVGRLGIEPRTRGLKVRTVSSGPLALVLPGAMTRTFVQRTIRLVLARSASWCVVRGQDVVTAALVGAVA